MRLINKKVGTNPETFAPEMVVTIAIPMTAEMNPTQPIKSFEEWGKEFLNLIGVKNERTN